MLRIGSDFLVNPDKLENVDLIPAKPVQTNGAADRGETTYCAQVAIYHSGGREHDLSFEGSSAEEADQAAREVFDKIHRGRPSCPSFIVGTDASPRRPGGFDGGAELDQRTAVGSVDPTFCQRK